jgi:hypothetical protein
MHAVSTWLRFTRDSHNGEQGALSHRLQLELRLTDLLHCQHSTVKLIPTSQTTYSTVIAQTHCLAFIVYHFVRHGGWSVNCEHLVTGICMWADSVMHRMELVAQFAIVILCYLYLGCFHLMTILLLDYFSKFCWDMFYGLLFLLFVLSCLIRLLCAFEIIVGLAVTIFWPSVKNVNFYPNVYVNIFE